MRVKFTLSLLALGLALTTPLTTQAGPAIQSWQTANGARVLFVPAPELPIVDLEVVFDAGSARDAASPGVATLTAGLLTEGAKTATGELNADQIAEQFANLGAQIGAGADRDMATVSLRSLSDPAILQPALDLMADLISAPTFPEGGFERQRKSMLIGLQAQDQSPGDIASKAFSLALYGTHPYAIQPLGNVASVNKLTRADIIAHHERYFVASNAVVAIVGALDRKTAEIIAEGVVGRLPRGTPPEALPEVAEAPGSTIKQTYPSAQSHILMGQAGLARTDPDYFPLLVGNHVLGGNGLVSRLSDEIRQKRGLAYSAYSYFQPLHVQGPYTLGLQTRNEQATEAVQVLRDTLEKFVADGPTAEELAAAQQNITGGFALRIDSNASVTNYLSLIGFYDLPLDFLDSYTAKVEQVTLEQVKDAYQRRIKPAAMVTVVVGGEPVLAAPADSGKADSEMADSAKVETDKVEPGKATP